MGAIDVLRVNTIELAHALGEIAFDGLDHDVVVVGHQAVGVTGPVESLTYSAKNIEPGKPIRIAGKDVLSPVTARGDVIQASGKFESQGTGHDSLYAMQIARPDCYVARPDPVTP
jgi:hypothetical protein